MTSRREERMLGVVKLIRATVKLERNSYGANATLDRVCEICDKALANEEQMRDSDQNEQELII